MRFITLLFINIVTMIIFITCARKLLLQHVVSNMFDFSFDVIGVEKKNMVIKKMYLTYLHPNQTAK